MSQAILLHPSESSDNLEQYSGQRRRYEVFCIAWAIATLFHMANHREFVDTFSNFLLTTAAVFLLIKPSSINRLLLLIFFQLFDVVKTMPYTSNHWVFTGLVNLSILQAMLYLAYRNKSFAINKDELITLFAPVVRIEVIILYFFVVFHKLNSGFFLAETSCAADFFRTQNTYALLPESKEILLLNAYLTVGIEALIPLLLCFRKTRNWAVLIGLIFHCVIAYNPTNGFYDFSSMIFAVYVLFTSQQFIDYANRLYVRLLEGIEKLKQAARFSLFKVGTILVAAVLAMGLLYLLTEKVEDFFRHIVWTVFSLTFITVFLVAMLKRKSVEASYTSSSFAVPHYAFLLFPVIMFLNGLSPYLGLKTENSFAMFSNLRTEGGVSNHYFVPATWQVFDYQKDLVEIISSTDPKLESLAREKKLMVYFMFKHHVAHKKPERIVYIRNGQRHTFIKADASTHQGLLQPNPIVLKKLLNFRNISKYDPQPCNH